VTGNFLNDASQKMLPRQFRNRHRLKMGRVWGAAYRPENFAKLPPIFTATPKLQTHWNSPLREVL